MISSPGSKFLASVWLPTPVFTSAPGLTSAGGLLSGGIGAGIGLISTGGSGWIANGGGGGGLAG